MVPFFGVPIIRVTSLYWGPPILGNYHLWVWGLGCIGVSIQRAFFFFGLCFSECTEGWHVTALRGGAKAQEEVRFQLRLGVLELKIQA